MVETWTVGNCVRWMNPADVLQEKAQGNQSTFTPWRQSFGDRRVAAMAGSCSEFYVQTVLFII